MTIAASGTALVSGALGTAGIVFAAENSTIFVSNVERLYEVVNDPTNAGAPVALSPGVNTVSARDAGGALRPNGGRLSTSKLTCRCTASSALATPSLSKHGVKTSSAIGCFRHHRSPSRTADYLSLSLPGQQLIELIQPFITT